MTQTVRATGQAAGLGPQGVAHRGHGQQKLCPAPGTVMGSTPPGVPRKTWGDFAGGCHCVSPQAAEGLRGSMQPCPQQHRWEQHKRPDGWVSWRLTEQRVSFGHEKGRRSATHHSAVNPKPCQTRRSHVLGLHFPEVSGIGESTETGSGWRRPGCGGKVGAGVTGTWVFTLG